MVRGPRIIRLSRMRRIFFTKTVRTMWWKMPHRMETRSHDGESESFRFHVHWKFGRGEFFFFDACIIEFWQQRVHSFPPALRINFFQTESSAKKLRPVVTYTPRFIHIFLPFVFVSNFSPNSCTRVVYSFGLTSQSSCGNEQLIRLHCIFAYINGYACIMRIVRAQTYNRYRKCYEI